MIDKVDKAALMHRNAYKDAKMNTELHKLDDDRYIERSISVLAEDYLKSLDSCAGIYFIYDNSKCLQFIGQSSDLRTAIKFNDKLIEGINFINVMIWKGNNVDLEKLRFHLINIYSPPLNKIVKAHVEWKKQLPDFLLEDPMSIEITNREVIVQFEVPLECEGDDSRMHAKQPTAEQQAKTLTSAMEFDDELQILMNSWRSKLRADGVSSEDHRYFIDLIDSIAEASYEFKTNIDYHYYNVIK